MSAAKWGILGRGGLNNFSSGSKCPPSSCLGDTLSEGAINGVLHKSAFLHSCANMCRGGPLRRPS